MLEVLGKFYEYISRFLDEAFWNSISVITKKDCANYIGTVWNKSWKLSQGLQNICYKHIVCTKLVHSVNSILNI